MSGKRKVVVIGSALAILILSLIAWIASSPLSRTDAPSSSSASSQSAPVRPPSDRRVGLQEVSEPSALPDTGSRSALRAAISVQDQGGIRLSGATVSWTVLGSKPDLQRDWPMPDPEVWASASTIATTDEHGEFQLDPPNGAADLPSVLWVTCPGRRARAFHLGPGETPAALADQISLELGERLIATVRLADESSVPGADVFQRLYLSPRERADLDGRDLAAAYALQRRVATDGSGRATLSDLGGRQVVSAASESRLSNNWIGSAPDEIELVIQPTFTWSGKLTLEDPTLELSTPTVLVVALTGSTRSIVDSATVRADGTLGPRSAPVVVADSYLFELEGAGIPTTVQRAQPALGENVDVMFVARRGVRYPVHVARADASAISGAEVRWAWDTGSGWQWTKRFSGEDGLAVLENALPGSSWLMVDKPGFIGFKQELYLESEFPGAFEVVLEPGATLRGHVLAEGEPVKSFTIVHRRADQIGDPEFADVYDSKDGSFAIEGLPAGERSVFAVATEWPRSSEQRVMLSTEADAAATFQLRAPGQAFGVVRDALTGEPVAGCAAQMWTTSGELLTRKWGPRRQGDSMGRFEISGLAATEAMTVEVSAPDYAREFRTVPKANELPVDLGVIGLSRSRKLTVHLRVPGGESVTKWNVRCADAPDSRLVAFPESGTVIFEGLQPAFYEVVIEDGPNASRRRSVEVPVDRDGETTFDVTEGADFVVQVLAGDVDFRPLDCWLLVKGMSGEYGSPRSHLLTIPGDGVVAVRGVLGDFASVLVVKRAGGILGSAILSADDIKSGRYVLELRDSQRSLRVVDSAHRPLAGVLTHVGTPKMNWLSGRTTDSDGRLTISGLSESSFDISLQLPPHGGGVIRDVRLGTDPIDIVFDPSATIRFRLLDGDVPVSGVSVRIRDGLGVEREFPTLVTDGSGTAVGEKYLPQAFVGITHQSGIWPATFTLQASESVTPTIVQVRRRGSVVLHARRDGLPLAGVALSVESVEFATNVSSWIADGAITASHAACVTDGQGRLRLDGLPRGPYRWSVTLDDGVQIGGNFDVEPQRRVDVDLTIP